MPNKTVYVKDSDLPLWALAQVYFGESISSAFARFLREKVPTIDAFVHVVQSGPPTPGEEQTYLVMFAPAGTTDASPMKPHCVRGERQLSRFLREIGFTEEANGKVVSDLKEQPSVSVRMSLARSVATTNLYSLHFRPIPVDAGKQSWQKVEAVGWPISPGGKRWSATFHHIERLLDVLSNQLGSPQAQLTAIRTALLAGQEVELGGISGAQFVLAEDHLIKMGLMPLDD